MIPPKYFFTNFHPAPFHWFILLNVRYY
jgi:hypothetical protein